MNSIFWGGPVQEVRSWYRKQCCTKAENTIICPESCSGTHSVSHGGRQRWSVTWLQFTKGHLWTSFIQFLKNWHLVQGIRPSNYYWMIFDNPTSILFLQWDDWNAFTLLDLVQLMVLLWELMLYETCRLSKLTRSWHIYYSHSFYLIIT